MIFGSQKREAVKLDIQRNATARNIAAKEIYERAALRAGPLTEASVCVKCLRAPDKVTLHNGARFPDHELMFAYAVSGTAIGEVQHSDVRALYHKCGCGHGWWTQPADEPPPPSQGEDKS